VHALGLRYCVGVRPIRGLRRTGDLVFTRARVVVFLDGCFWHGCPDHHTVAKTNAAYWADKVVQNRLRDQETDLCCAKTRPWSLTCRFALTRLPCGTR
jgi:DNA mismatch endonuclease, patch repair protein